MYLNPYEHKKNRTIVLPIEVACPLYNLDKPKEGYGGLAAPGSQDDPKVRESIEEKAVAILAYVLNRKPEVVAEAFEARKAKLEAEKLEEVEAEELDLKRLQLEVEQRTRELKQRKGKLGGATEAPEETQPIGNLHVLPVVVVED